MKRQILLLTLVTAFSVEAQKLTHVPPLVYEVENTAAGAPKPLMPPAGELPVVRELPDALEGVKDFGDWARRRSEIGYMVQHYELGEKPVMAAGEVVAYMDADTLIVTVTVEGRALTLRSTIHYPKVGQPPFALMIGTSGISLPHQLFDGKPIATMIFHENQANAKK